VTRLYRGVSMLAIAAAAAAAMLPGAIPAAATTSSNVPTLTGPANGTSEKDVVLTWSKVVGASEYQVQVSPNEQWTNNSVTLADNGDSVNTTYEMPLSLPHGAYFWHVRAKVGSTWFAYSTADEFVRSWPNAPIHMITTPTNGSDPTLSWAPVTDASLYRVRFSTESDFPSDPKKTFTCWTTNTSFTPYELMSTDSENAPTGCFAVSDLTTATQYFWEVGAYDDSTAPVLVADTTNDPAFECAQTQPECDTFAFSGSTFLFTAPAAGSVGVGNVTGLKTSWHTTVAAPPTTCGSVNDTDPGTVCTDTPTFSWNPVAGANYYRVHIWRSTDGLNTYRVYDTAWPELTPRDSFFDAQAGVSYTWQVEAGTCENNPGVDDTCQHTDDQSTIVKQLDQASALASFNKASGTVPLIGPADKSVVAGHNPTFSWGDFQANGGDGAYDAENYELQVATDPSFSNVVTDVADIDLTQYTQADKLMTDGNYYWRVAPIDESGNLLSWSATRQITIDDTVPDLSLSTKSGVAVTGPLTFTSTQDVTGVSSSSVELTAGNGSVVKGTVRKTGSSGTAWTFTPTTKLVTGQTYQLKLTAEIPDDAGNDAVVTGSSIRTTTKADNSSKAWSFSSGWAAHSASAAKGGSYREAKKGKTASITVVGKTATVYGCKGPSMGTIRVTVGGKAHSVNEHQSFTSCGVEVWHGSLPSGQVKIAVKVMKSKGDIDELTVT
jgi:hypothetical protein